MPKRDIATAQLSGNLARDVELRPLPSGAEVARLRVASSTRRRTAENQWVDRTIYLTVDVFGGQAAACAEHLRKGSRVLVDAELDWREWTDQQDNRREAVTLRARHVLFEGAREPAEAPAAGDRQRQSAPEPAPAAAATAATGPATQDGTATEDDLPF